MNLLLRLRTQTPVFGLVLNPTSQPASWWLTGLILILLTSGAWAQCFQSTLGPTTQAAYPVGINPYSVAVGDFNGDGKPDLAVATYGSNSVSVLLGSGSGGFGAATRFGAGSGPRSVAVGDFNGDGKPDLAVTNFFSNSVSVLLGNGSGGFGAATSFGVGTGPISVAVGDFNGDAKPDLATANQDGNSVSVLLGSGSGGFGAATRFGVGTAPQSVVVGDFNGDNKPDLATANSRSDNVSVLLGSGSGGFGAATNFGVGSYPTSVAVGDFNGDNKPDLAVANNYSFSVSVLLGSGSGGFGAATSFGVGSGPQSVVVEDFNGDNKPDLATANSGNNNVSVLLGSGSGGFGAATRFGVGSDPRSVVVGDFDGDTKPDLATANYDSDNVSVLYNCSIPVVNTPPVATANPSQTATVGAAFSYTVNAFTDAETPNSLTYTASIDPANGLSFNPVTRVISGTPSLLGVSSVTITATDPGSLSASTSFSITVNSAPVTALTLVATANPTTILTTGTTTLSATVSGGTGPYSYTFSGPGTISQMPTSNTATVSNPMAGVQTFTVTASDTTTPTSQTISGTVSVTVNQANRAPVAVANTNQSATVGTAFTYMVNAFTDPDGDALTYTASINPVNGFTFNPATRVISGTPTNTGTSSVTVTATDPGSLSASTSFSITVSDPASPIRYVRAGVTGSGNSWADASGDLQSQINLTGAQQVWVATGTYKPGGNANTDRTISFAMKNGVAIYGGFPATGDPTLTARNPTSFTTVLSGDLGTVGDKADNSLHVFFNPEGLTATAVLDGIVIRDGNATTINPFPGPPDPFGFESSGGGMFNRNTSPTLTNCSFLNNSGGSSFGGGGGLYNDSSSPTLTNCRFQGNTAQAGGGMGNFYSSNPSLTNCSFVSNSAEAGGGVYNQNDSSPTLTNCSFRNNTGFRLGGGMYTSGGRPTLTNCVLFGNGGASTFLNPDNEIYVTVTYSLLEAGTTNFTDGGNNLTTSVSPFVNSTDARLNACALAIDAGNNGINTTIADLALNPRRYNGGLIDMGAYEFQGQPNVPTAITQQPPSGSLVCQGSTVSIPLSVSGTDALTYQLVDATGTPVGPSQSTTPLTLATVQPAQSGSYSVIVTGSCNSVTSTAFSLTVNAPPVATLTASPSGGLSCAQTSLTLTAGGGDTYAFSGPGILSQSGNQATVNAPGTYSVTVTNASCTGTTTITVSGTTGAPDAPILTATPATTTTNQPITFTAGGCPGGTINWTAGGGTGTASGTTYTVSQPGNYTLSATCTLNGCTSVASAPLAVQIRPGGFAITGVSPVSCQLLDAGRGQYEVRLTPQYTDAAGPVSFSIVNELSPTTAPGPYTLRLYRDNPLITLVATQNVSPETRFVYNWLAACSAGTSPNRPPVARSIPDQTLPQGQAYSLELANYITDPDGQPLTFQATGLPADLSLVGSRISGTAATTGVSTITIKALDPGGLEATTQFQLTVTPLISTPAGFTIVGVTTVSCQTLSPGQRQVQFLPQYGGLTDQPITFQVINELAPTQRAGPYTLNLYTDNPVISLQATQTGSTAPATYRYDWLAGCGTTPTTPPPANRAPVVSGGVANQTATVGQGYTLVIPAGSFTDPDGDALSLRATGLPAGLSLAGSTLTGTPATPGVSTVILTAADPAGLSATLSFTLTVIPATGNPPSADFAITAVGTRQCEVISAGQRRVSFTPQYSGVSNSTISFSVVNELSPTTAPGPYSLTLYTDNPIITLQAQQGTSLASYRYEWLAACNARGRQGAAELSRLLQVVVLGNPVVGEALQVEVRGAAGQPLRVQLSDLSGRGVSERVVEQAGRVETLSLPVGSPPAGLLLLRVSTPIQSQTVKVVKH